MGEKHGTPTETPRGQDRRSEEKLPYAGEERRKGDRRKPTSS